MKTTLLSMVLAVSAFAAPPVIGPLLPLDAPVVVPSRAGNGLALVRGVRGVGNVGLVVWADQRAGSVRRLYATRVDASGQPLDKPFLEVSDDCDCSSDSRLVRGVFDGTHFVLTWINARANAVLLRRLSPQGTFVDAAPLTVTTVNLNTFNGPNVASDGAGLTLVTWTRTIGFNNSVLEARRLQNGAFLDAAPLALGAVQPIGAPALAWDGTQFVEFFLTGTSTAYTLSSRRIASTGVLTATASLRALGTESPRLDVACATADCLLVWGSGATTVGVRTANGALVDPNPVTLLTRNGRTLDSPTIVFDGTRYWVTVSSRGTSAFDDTGVVLRVSDVLMPLGTTDLTSTFAPTGFVAAPGTYFALPGGRVVLQRIDSAGALLDAQPTQLDWAANDQRSPRVAFGQGTWLIAWIDSREAGDVLFARRFDATGASLDAQPLRLGAMSGMFSGTVGNVLFDGQNFVVGWSENGVVRAARVSVNGALLDGLGGTALSPAGVSNPRFVFDGTRTWSAWQMPGQVDIAGARLSTAGVLLDMTPLPLVATTATERTPSVCFDGADVWLSWVNLTTNELRASRLSAAGALVTPGGLLVASSSDGALASGPACAAGWRDFNSVPRATRLGPTGALDGTGRALSTVTTDLTPSLSWNGARFVAVVKDRQANALSVTRFEDGGVLDATPSTVALANPALALDATSNLRGRSLVVNQHFVSSPALQTQRVFFQFVDDLANGEACSSGAPCHSGFCVDGVCCNSACAGGTSDCSACSTTAGAAVSGVCGPTSGNACNDSNACTMTDQCNAGACFGMNPVTCAPPGECEVGNVCVPMSGTCQLQLKADGTACSVGMCLAGRCVATDGGSGTGGGTAGGSPTGGGTAGGTATGGGTAGGIATGGGLATGGGVATGGGSAGGAAFGGGTSFGGGVASGGGATGGGGGTGMPSGCTCSGTGGFDALAVLGVMLLRRRARSR